MKEQTLSANIFSNKSILTSGADNDELCDLEAVPHQDKSNIVHKLFSLRISNISLKKNES